MQLTELQSTKHFHAPHPSVPTWSRPGPDFGPDPAQPTQMVPTTRKTEISALGSGQMASHVFKNFFGKPEMWDGIIEMTTDKKKGTEFFKLTNMRVLHTFAILCMSLAPRQADRARSLEIACWRPPGRCWLWRWQAAAYDLPSPAQPPPGPSPLLRRSIAGSTAAVARCARTGVPWARHARCAPHPTPAGPLPPPWCATRRRGGRWWSQVGEIVRDGSGHRIGAAMTTPTASRCAFGTHEADVPPPC
eukprot:COSAG04_NODE_4554_length_2020_cov_3.933889_1_plen_247_part_00